MKIGIAGTGAVGGYFGGFLKKAGNECLFLARGPKLESMKENGLTMETEEGTFVITDTFTDKYEDFADVDLLLICVKSTSTEEVAAKFKPILKSDCLIMTLQNGVDNEEILSNLFGRDRVLAAASYIQATVLDSGVVKQIGVAPRLVIGALESGLTEKINEITLLFNAAKIETFPSSDILTIKWKKLLWNVTFNPLTALIQSKVAAVYEHVGLKQTAIKICKEAISVAQAVGIPLEDDDFETIMAQGEMAKEHHTSMLQDKLKGKQMELESICGYIVKKGKEVRVETPVLETIYHLLSYQSQ